MKIIVVAFVVSCLSLCLAGGTDRFGMPKVDRDPNVIGDISGRNLGSNRFIYQPKKMLNLKVFKWFPLRLVTFLY